MISKIIAAFQSLMVPHDKMVRDLEAKRQKPIENPCYYEPGKSLVEALQKKGILENPNVTSPKTYLGEKYGSPLHWEHEDDQIVEFQILEMIAMTDIDFFARYVGLDSDSFAAPRGLTADEKATYPQYFYPCFADVEEVVRAQMTSPLKFLNNQQEAFIVAFQETLGILIMNHTDVVDLQRRQYGMEEEKREQYHLQFFRFSEAAVERFSMVQPVNDYYLQMNSANFPTLRVNFAPFKED